jgi:acetyl esterase
MNWKTKIVLLFAKLRKPIEPGLDIAVMRGRANRAAWLGSVLFDKKIAVSSVTDASAGGVPVRIYNNSDATGQRVLLYYHGGGFALYGLASHDRVCRRLCKMNECIVVSVDYRLAPEHPFPAAHDDAFKAIRWMVANIEKYGGNPAKLIVAGDSAGGTLSAGMAHRCKREGIPLLAQVLIYPWVDGKINNPSIDRNGEGYLLTRKPCFGFRNFTLHALKTIVIL